MKDSRKMVFKVSCLLACYKTCVVQRYYKSAYDQFWFYLAFCTYTNVSIAFWTLTIKPGSSLCVIFQNTPSLSFQSVFSLNKTTAYTICLICFSDLVPVSSVIVCDRNCCRSKLLTAYFSTKYIYFCILEWSRNEVKDEYLSKILPGCQSDFKNSWDFLQTKISLSCPHTFV